MSIGNLKTEGNKGNNFPYQLKVLQGLQCVCDQLKELNVDTTAIEAALLDIEGTLQQLETNTTGVERTPNFLRPAGVTGNTPVGIFSVSFASVGTANATVGGMILKPGETLNLDAGALNNTLGTIAYSTTTVGAELIIIFLI
jgi:hypothetical protein